MCWALGSPWGHQEENLKEVWAYKIFIFELGFPWGHQEGKFEGSLSIPKIRFQAWTSLGSSGRKVWRNCECTKYSFSNLGLLGVANTSISRNFLPKAYLTFHRHLPYGCLRVKIKVFFELLTQVLQLLQRTTATTANRKWPMRENSQ